MSEARLRELETEIATLDASIVESDVTSPPDDSVVGVAGAISPEQLGNLYKNIRPILVLVSKLWFFPTKWQSLLTTFLKYMDAITGTTEGNLG